jgi:DNA ligase (NAD+)
MKVTEIVRLINSDPDHVIKTLKPTQLVRVLKHLSTMYYNFGDSLVSDEVFDYIKEELEKKSPDDTYLKAIGAPISKNKVKLPYWLGSLNKNKADTSVLKKWLDKYPGPSVISNKLDGVSCCLYKKNNEVKMYTRGDGEHGQDISHLAPYVLKGKLKFAKIPNGVAVRGELIMSKTKFKKFKDEQKNARNLVAGLVNSKHFNISYAEATDFIAYEIIHPQYTRIDQMKQLLKWNFRVVTQKTMDHKKISNEYLSKYLEKQRAGGKYRIDGIVVADSSKSYKPITTKNPPFAFAFKTVITNQMAEATVLAVEWNVSRLDYLIPRVKITPVVLDDVTIQYATAHNAKYVADNVIGPGSVIKIIRSGDVIPYIQGIISPATNGHASLPKVASKWTKTGVHLISKSKTNTDDVTIKRLAFFFQTVGVKHLSEGIIAKLVKNKYKTIHSIILADKEKLEDIDGLGEKNVTKIWDNISKSLKIIPLERLMAASQIFGRGFGTRRSRVIVTAFPDFIHKKWSAETAYDKAMALDGFNEITATQFSDNLESFYSFVSCLRKIIDIPSFKIQKKKNSTTMDKHIIVFTGFRDKALEEKIMLNGGKVTTTVSSKTTLVVTDPKSPPGSKLQKAKSLNIIILTRDEFVKQFSL